MQPSAFKDQVRHIDSRSTCPDMFGLFHAFYFVTRDNVYISNVFILSLIRVFIMFLGSMLLHMPAS